MATTTNYGWTTPDDTDLVKDGAAAIRTLGSSVDTTTKALNPETTTGDIAYRSATANTNTRLALGTAGQVLTVNSGATAPEWATPAAGGGMTLLSTTTLSGTSTTISNINQTYKDLIIRVFGITTSTNTSNIRLQMNSATGMSICTIGSPTGGSVLTTAPEQQQLTDGDKVLTAANANRAWTVQITDYATTDGIKVAGYNGVYVGTTDTHPIMGTMTNNSTAAVTSIILACPQTFTAGTVKIWGVN
jgi:hypothetical protein